MSAMSTWGSESKRLWNQSQSLILSCLPILLLDKWDISFERRAMPTLITSHLFVDKSIWRMIWSSVITISKTALPSKWFGSLILHHKTQMRSDYVQNCMTSWLCRKRSQGRSSRVLEKGGFRLTSSYRWQSFSGAGCHFPADGLENVLFAVN